MSDVAWTAPEVERPTAPNVAPEREAAESLLEYHRATLLWKCAGLTGGAAARRAVPPSTMSLLGLVRHMAEVERDWFRHAASPASSSGRSTGPTPARTATSTTSTPRPRRRTSRRTPREVDAARAVQAAHEFDDTFVRHRARRHRRDVDIRALVLHMIEEYARHNGHADLLREVVDGRTGE